MNSFTLPKKVPSQATVRASIPHPLSPIRFISILCTSNPRRLDSTIDSYYHALSPSLSVGVDHEILESEGTGVAGYGLIRPQRAPKPTSPYSIALDFAVEHVTSSPPLFGGHIIIGVFGVSASKADSTNPSARCPCPAGSTARKSWAASIIASGHSGHINYRERSREAPRTGEDVP